MINCAKGGTRHDKPWTHYRPSHAERSAHKRRQFDALAVRIRQEGLTDELRTQLDAVRPRKCLACRRIQWLSDVKPTTIKGQCRAKWYELRSAACHDCKRNDGPVEYDHQKHLGEKLHHLGDYAWWVTHGGVEAMELESRKCIPRCRNCHMLQETMPIYQREYASWEDMPDETDAQKRAKYDRMYCDEKYAYVNSIKDRIGCCEECALRVTPETHHVFVFAHRDATTKQFNVSDLCNRRTPGVPRLLENARPLIDAEVLQCRLLCHVCHSKETRLRNGDLELEQVLPDPEDV